MRDHEIKSAKENLINAIRNDDLLTLKQVFENSVKSARSAEKESHVDDLLTTCLLEAATLGLSDILEYLFQKTSNLSNLKISKIRAPTSLNDFDLLGLAARSGSVLATRVVANKLKTLGPLDNYSSYRSPLVACATRAQIATFDVLMTEFGFASFNLTDGGQTILEQSVYYYAENVIDEKFVKHALNTINFSENAKHSAREKAVDILNVKIARVLLADEISSSASFRKKLGKKSNQKFFPGVKKLLKQISCYIDAAEAIQKSVRLLPVSIEELDQLINRWDHSDGDANGQFILHVEMCTDFLLDYIEMQIHNPLNQPQKDFLESLITLLTLYHVRRGRPDIIAPLFSLQPDLVHLTTRPNLPKQ